MENKEKILNFIKESTKNIFNGLFIVEVISAVFINLWVSYYLTNLLDKSSLLNKAYYVIGPFSYFVAVLIALTLIVLIEWKNRSKLFGAYSLFVLLAAINASSNWLKMTFHGTLRTTFGWIAVFSTLPYIILFIATVQIIKILKNERVLYGFLTIGYIDLLVKIPLLFLMKVQAKVANPIFFAIEVALFFFVAYIPYFTSNSKYFAGINKAFSYSIRTFVFTIIVSIIFAALYLLSMTAHFQWPGIYVKQMFMTYIFVSFFIVTTIKAKSQ